MPSDTSTSTIAVRIVRTRRMRPCENWRNATSPTQPIEWTARMPAMKLSICAIASEVVPLAKSGGLADVASTLSRQLTAGGHDVRLFMPFYSQVKRDRLEATRVETLQGLAIVTGRHEYRVDIWKAKLPGSSTPIYLVESEALYARSRLY